MQLSEYLGQAGKGSPELGNPSVECNTLYKTKQNINCYLTPRQAMAFARHLLEKAQIILDNGIDDAAVQVWNQGEQNEKVYFGLIPARKGPRRKSRSSA